MKPAQDTDRGTVLTELVVVGIGLAILGAYLFRFRDLVEQALRLIGLP